MRAEATCFPPVQAERCIHQAPDHPLLAGGERAIGHYLRLLFTCYRSSLPALTQDDGPYTLEVAATFLLSDARENEAAFELMNQEGVFTRLIDLVATPTEDQPGVHRLLMELLYEMSRVQRIRIDDLST